MSTLSVPRVAGASARPEARRTAPHGVLVKAVGSLPSLIPAVAALLFTQRDAPAPLAAVLPLAALLVVTVCVVSYLTWRRTTYRVGAEDIRVESGIVSRAARSVPYERIQDVSLEQAFLPRLFGLVEVRFDTGAGAKDEVKLTYLTHAEGERLRDLVRERRAGSDASLPAGAEAVDAGERVLFAMPPRRVLTLGLFQFSLVVVGVVAGAVQQFDFLLPFDPYDLDDWQRRLAGPGAWLAGLGAGAQAVGAVLALLSLGFIGVLSGVGRTALKEWNFTLTRTSKGFRRRCGLLTRTDMVMPVHRVQAVEVATRPVRYRFGWRSAAFISLGSESGSHGGVIAPLARLEEIAPLAQEAGFPLPPDDLPWHPLVAFYARVEALRSAARWLLATGVLAVNIALWPSGVWSDWRWLLAPLVLGAARSAYRWGELRHQRYALDARLLYRAGGWLAPHLALAAREKLHSAEIFQGPVGRRLGYVTLKLGLAGGTFTVPALTPAEAERLRAALLESMTARDFSAVV